MRLSKSAPIALIFLAACASQARVVREGPGWREVEGSQPGQTTVEITSNDSQVLAELVKHNPDVRIRTMALDRVKDPAVFAWVARFDREPALRKRAVDRVEDPNLLDDIAKKDPDDGVKLAAATRRDLLRVVDSGTPEYKSWMACRSGAWVKMKLEISINDSRWSGHLQRVLLACRPERAVMEQRDLASGKGMQGMYKELFGRFDVYVGREENSTRELEIGGRVLPCRWSQWSFQDGHDIVHVKRWFSDAVPGGIARITLEVSPEGQPLKTLSLTATEWGASGGATSANR